MSVALRHPESVTEAVPVELAVAEREAGSVREVVGVADEVPVDDADEVEEMEEVIEIVAVDDEDAELVLELVIVEEPEGHAVKATERDTEPDGERMVETDKEATDDFVDDEVAVEVYEPFTLALVLPDTVCVFDCVLEAEMEVETEVDFEPLSLALVVPETDGDFDCVLDAETEGVFVGVLLAEGQPDSVLELVELLLEVEDVEGHCEAVEVLELVEEAQKVGELLLEAVEDEEPVEVIVLELSGARARSRPLSWVFRFSRLRIYA
jgi:hypothetical protein